MIDFFKVLSSSTLPMIVFLLAMIVSMILQAKDGKNSTPKYTKLRIYVTLLGIAFLAIPFLSSSIHESIMRNKIKEILVNKINSTNRIYLNKKLLKDSNASKILKELQYIKSVVAHNSAPTGYEFSIDIEYRHKLINFRLKQDGKRVHEYWVNTNYFENNKYKYYYIGRINTDYFDIWTKPKGKNFY